VRGAVLPGRALRVTPAEHPYTTDGLQIDVREGDEVLECVEVLSETPYGALPPAAVARLGIASGQKNVLLRVVLRALDRTLTHHECNELRDAIYAALHRGSAWQWAARAAPDGPRPCRA